MSAAALLAAPLPAQAAPLAPLPLAPACDQYGFAGVAVLGQSNGYHVSLTGVNGKSASGGQAISTSDDGRTKTFGSISDGAITGRTVNLTIVWSESSKGIYNGTIGDDGKVHGGSTYDAMHPESRASWDSETAFDCLTPTPAAPAQAPAAPAQKPEEPAPAPAAKPLATVTADNDVYDVPNVPPGKGKKIGVLTAGRQVEVIGKCSADDWNTVVVPDMPGGQGAAWGFITCP
ncbi:hypothetical protein DVS77_18275 [Mycolicibacterium moriokaense]|nr:hypothetical protein DVS77_18275 [Mycolicibacterium moriokaense]